MDEARRKPSLDGEQEPTEGGRELELSQAPRVRSPCRVATYGSLPADHLLATLDDGLLSESLLAMVAGYAREHRAGKRVLGR